MNRLFSDDEVALDVLQLDNGDAEQTGCWYPQVKLNEKVKAGQKLGEIRDYFGNVLAEYAAPCDGTVLYVIASLAINTGDPMYALGKE